MKMIIVILARLIKKVVYVLLVGWTPKPPEDFSARLSAVETLARKLDKRAQRAGDQAETAEPGLPQDNHQAQPAIYNGAPYHG